ncbi:hypothetical protein Bca101_047787 [Brassica carinata]
MLSGPDLSPSLRGLRLLTYAGGKISKKKGRIIKKQKLNQNERILALHHFKHSLSFVLLYSSSLSPRSRLCII